MREFDFIEWIRRQGGLDPSVVPVGPGDDCAVVKVGGEELLVTTDQVVDGVHVSLAEHGPEPVGRKAAARAISDIAAMAGVPVGMVASVAAPPGLSRADAEAIYRGLRSAGDPLGCPLVGGDVAAWSGEAERLQMTVTVFGRADGVGPILRAGAAPGDAICVTGAFGGAWRSERHLTFIPRVTEARILAGRYDVRAMIDVSDGLAADLGRILEASDVGAEIEAACVPLSEPAAAALRNDPGLLEVILTGGDDYELLFTVASGGESRV
ncbi:hypothetical protein LCGC14_1683170, partial [marine sediment metagenome]